MGARNAAEAGSLSAQKQGTLQRQVQKLCGSYERCRNQFWRNADRSWSVAGTRNAADADSLSAQKPGTLQRQLQKLCRS